MGDHNHREILRPYYLHNKGPESPGLVMNNTFRRLMIIGEDQCTGLEAV